MTDLTIARIWALCDQWYELPVTLAFETRREAEKIVETYDERHEIACELLTALEQAQAQIDDMRPRGFAGIIDEITRYYPMDVPYFAKSDDLGCQMARMMHAVVASRKDAVIGRVRLGIAERSLEKWVDIAYHDCERAERAEADRDKLRAELDAERAKRCAACEYESACDRTVTIKAGWKPMLGSCSEWTARKDEAK